MTVTVTGGSLSKAEINAYVQQLKEKNPDKVITSVSFTVDGEYVDMSYTYDNVPFERIRRITGSEGAWEIETGCAGTLGVMVRGKVQIRIGDGPEQVYSGAPGAPAFVRVPVPAAGCRVSIISMQTI